MQADLALNRLLHPGALSSADLVRFGQHHPLVEI
jgi:hypothetical protein